MTTIRVARRNRFTTVDRTTVNDSRLSFRARGVLMWLLDKPDEWRADARTIAQAGSEGRDAVRAALAELEEHGYLVRNKYRGDGGRWVTEHTVYERPQGGDQGWKSDLVDDAHQVGKPAPVNQRRSTSAGFPGPITKTENEDCYPPTPQGGWDGATHETLGVVMRLLLEGASRRPRAATVQAWRRHAVELVAKFPTAPATLIVSAVRGEPVPNLNLYRSTG